ncbi:MAG: hypothetical protein QOK16_4119 [Solirubrobacteraceae bacterium]|jgi:hypothetical protein|nr:hypothetical protein [Solirubrobacteraceae bacterium]
MRWMIGGPTTTRGGPHDAQQTPGSSYAETIENLVKLREGLDDIHTNGFT